MGAEYLEYTIDDELNQIDLDLWLRDQQIEDNDYNGHRDGYSGDTQTIDQIKLSDKIFNSMEELEDYCLENAQKWHYGIAGHIKINDKTKTYIGFWAAC